MPRYIIQDRYTGFIWGDTGDLDGPDRAESPTEACQRLDESLGTYGRTYTEVSRSSGAGDGYTVWRADENVNGGSLIISDGQDRETIEAVERDFELVCLVEWQSPE